jgi:hypothetical protein
VIAAPVRVRFAALMLPSDPRNIVSLPAPRRMAWRPPPSQNIKLLREPQSGTPAPCAPQNSYPFVGNPPPHVPRTSKLIPPGPPFAVQVRGEGVRQARHATEGGGAWQAERRGGHQDAVRAHALLQAPGASQEVSMAEHQGGGWRRGHTRRRSPVAAGPAAIEAFLRPGLHGVARRPVTTNRAILWWRWLSPHRA